MLRNMLYQLARNLGDGNAIIRGKVGQRYQRKRAGTNFFSMLERFRR